MIGELQQHLLPNPQILHGLFETMEGIKQIDVHYHEGPMVTIENHGDLLQFRSGAEVITMAKPVITREYDGGYEDLDD